MLLLVGQLLSCFEITLLEGNHRAPQQSRPAILRQPVRIAVERLADALKSLCQVTLMFPKICQRRREAKLEARIVEPP